MIGKIVNGVPTAPDVKRIVDALGGLERGQEIAHEDIEQIIGEKWRSGRYRTVTDAWRKKVYGDLNLLIAAVSGIGFRVLTENECVDTTRGWFRAGIRKTSRSIDVNSRINSNLLDEPVKRVHQIQSRLMNAHRTEIINATKKLSAELRLVKQLPREAGE